MIKIALSTLDDIAESVRGFGATYFEQFDTVQASLPPTEPVGAAAHQAADLSGVEGVLYFVAKSSVSSQSDSSPLAEDPNRDQTTSPSSQAAGKGEEETSAFATGSNNSSFISPEAYNRAVSKQTSTHSPGRSTAVPCVLAFIVWAPVEYLRHHYPVLFQSLNRPSVSAPAASSTFHKKEDTRLLCLSVLDIETLVVKREGVSRSPVRIFITARATSGYRHLPSQTYSFTFHYGGMTRFFEALHSIRPDLVSDETLNPVREVSPRGGSSLGKMMKMLYSLGGHSKSEGKPPNSEGGGSGSGCLEATGRGEGPPTEPPLEYQGRVVEKTKKEEETEREEVEEEWRDPCPNWCTPTAETLEHATEAWRQCFDDSGTLMELEFFNFRKEFFNNGSFHPLPEAIRFAVWAYCLELFHPKYNEKEKNDVLESNLHLYDTLMMQWSTISEEQEQNFSLFRNNRDKIVKDVKRTDRSHPLLIEDDSSKLNSIKHILLCYLFYDFDFGYIQGMSDIASVMTLSTQTEEEGFFYFKGLMQKHFKRNFVHEKGSEDVQSRLKQLKVLVRYFLPTLYRVLEGLQNEELHFCFGFLITCFKRELKNNMEEVLWLWDYVVMCPYHTDFPLLVLFGILREYARTEALCQNLFSSDSKLITFVNSFSAPVYHLVSWGVSAHRFICQEAYHCINGAPPIDGMGESQLDLPLSKAIHIFENYGTSTLPRVV